MPSSSQEPSLASLLQARELGGPPPSGAGRGVGGPAAPALAGWAERASLRRLGAGYCPTGRTATSTIAAAFSPDGSLLASTQCAPGR